VKVEVDRDVLVWLHKQYRNVFLTIVGASLDSLRIPTRPTRRLCGTAQAAGFAWATTGSSTALRATS
jgi:hypothetical protein